MKSYISLFDTFSKIGAFTIGGGYVMIPIIKREVVEKKGWLSESEFFDVLTISQSAPGILAINISIFIGYRLKGVKGSIVAALGTALPSFIIILLIAMFFNSFRENQIVERVFKGIRPAVVALIAVPVISMAKACKLTAYSVIIPVISVIVIVFTPISPIYLIIFGALYGIFYSKWFKR